MKIDLSVVQSSSFMVFYRLFLALFFLSAPFFSIKGEGVTDAPDCGNVHGQGEREKMSIRDQNEEERRDILSLWFVMLIFVLTSYFAVKIFPDALGLVNVSKYIIEKFTAIELHNKRIHLAFVGEFIFRLFCLFLVFLFPFYFYVKWLDIAEKIMQIRFTFSYFKFLMYTSNILLTLVWLGFSLDSIHPLAYQEYVSEIFHPLFLNICRILNCYLGSCSIFALCFSIILISYNFLAEVNSNFPIDSSDPLNDDYKEGNSQTSTLVSEPIVLKDF